MILAAGTLGTLVSSSAFAEDGSISSAAAPKMTAQVQVELLPLGSGKATVGDTEMTTDAALAYGVSGMFDYALTPYLSIGVAPRLVLNVAEANAADGDKANQEVDLRARIRGHYPVMPGLELNASLSPGYTIALSSEEAFKSGGGFAIGGAVGLTYDVSPRLFVAGEVGYQRAFITSDFEVAGQTFSSDVDLSYMHVGLGAGTRF
jgi:hypothetical protein